MKKTYTLIVGNWKDGIILEKWFWDNRPSALACGASQEQKQMYQQQSSFYNQMMNQAQQVFGLSSGIFNDLQSAFAPIVAAGPGQEGYSPAEKAALQSQAVTDTGNAYRNASTAVKQANAAVGGGNMALPGGAEIGRNLSVANAAAAQTSKNLMDINLASKNLGRQNFFQGASVLAGAPNVFNPATGFNNSTIAAGNSAADEANKISEANNSWANAVMGLAGGLAQTAVGFIPGAGPALSSAFGAMKPGQISGAYGGPTSAQTTSASSPWSI